MSSDLLVQRDHQLEKLEFALAISQTKGDKTRFSVDLRVVPSGINSLVRDEYLEEYSSGIIECVSKRFNEKV